MQTKWYNLGLQLSLRVITQDTIRRDFSNLRDRFLQMLISWLSTGYNHSWKTLTDALRSRNIGASLLADRLEAKYCRPKGKH